MGCYLFISCVLEFSGRAKCFAQYRQDAEPRSILRSQRLLIRGSLVAYRMTSNDGMESMTLEITLRRRVIYMGSLSWDGRYNSYPDLVVGSHHIIQYMTTITDIISLSYNIMSLTINIISLSYHPHILTIELQFNHHPASHLATDLRCATPTVIATTTHCRNRYYFWLHVWVIFINRMYSFGPDATPSWHHKLSNTCVTDDE